jgi:carboxyl-terminal processing protease
VQTILPLNFGAQLKITTARYYIPSGRSIQEIDYLHKDKNGVFVTVPDSLRKEFRTAHGRKVFEHGGIAPDSVVAQIDEGPMVRELQRKSEFFKFANKYVAEHKDSQPTGVTDAMLADFKKFLDQEKFDFQEETESKIKDLREVAERLHYSRDMLSDLDLLKSAVDKEKNRGYERYKDHISTELWIEVMARLKGERGRIEASFADDAQLKTAIGIVKNPKVLKRELGS